MYLQIVVHLVKKGVHLYTSSTAIVQIVHSFINRMKVLNHYTGVFELHYRVRVMESRLKNVTNWHTAVKITAIERALDIRGYG